MTSKNGATSTTSTPVLPQPERLGVGTTDEGLVEIEIQLRRFHLFVREADGLTRFKVSSLVTETMKDIGDPKGYDEIVRANMITEVWVPLSVCSRGEVPTKEQFLSLPKGDLAFWVETARELGHEFAWLDGLNRVYESAVDAKERALAETKKKGKIPQESTRPS